MKRGGFIFFPSSSSSCSWFVGPLFGGCGHGEEFRGVDRGGGEEAGEEAGEEGSEEEAQGARQGCGQRSEEGDEEDREAMQEGVEEGYEASDCFGEMSVFGCNIDGAFSLYIYIYVCMCVYSSCFELPHSPILMRSVVIFSCKIAIINSKNDDKSSSRLVFFFFFY